MWIGRRVGAAGQASPSAGSNSRCRAASRDLSAATPERSAQVCVPRLGAIPEFTRENLREFAGLVNHPKNDFNAACSEEARAALVALQEALGGEAANRSSEEGWIATNNDSSSPLQHAGPRHPVGQPAKRPRQVWRSAGRAREKGQKTQSFQLPQVARQGSRGTLKRPRAA